MRITIATVLETSVERAWAEVQTARLLRHVARPLMIFAAIDPPTLPEVWRDGAYRVRLLGFGLIPLGQQTIVTTRPMLGPDRFQVRDNGHGAIASTWDHLITLERLGPDRCLYRDEVEVAAGLLTPLVWLFAQIFYAHRQRRWRKLVRGGFAY